MISAYTMTICMCWMTLAILCILVHENGRIQKADKRWFYLAYIVIAAAALAEWGGIQLSRIPGLPGWVLQSVKCADYMLTPIVGWALIQHTNPRGACYRLLLGLLAVNTVFQLVSAFTGWTVVVTDAGYVHGPLYVVYMVIYLAIVALVLAEFVLYGRSFRRQNRASLYAILILTVSGIVAQELMSGSYRVAYLALTAGAALLFIHYTEFSQLVTDEQMIRQQAAILVLQMRPHFICNTLMSIYYLCNKDVKKAQRVTLDFTEYLRRNFTALTKEGTIPFAEELEHTRAYLAVAQAQYEGMLSVAFDTPCTAFKLPPLTLQPIVENAVKYGINPNADPLLLSVRTQETETGCEIVVEDTGPGFVPQDDNTTHTALSNIRDRLNMMCGGTLTIEQRPAGGTRVTISVPKDGCVSIAQDAFDGTGS